MTLRVGAQTFTFQVPNTSTSPLVVEQDYDLMAEGPSVVSVSFDNDFYDEVAMADCNLLVDYIEVIGPIGATSSNPLRDSIVVCDFVNQGDRASARSSRSSARERSATRSSPPTWTCYGLWSSRRIKATATKRASTSRSGDAHEPSLPST